MLNPAASSQSHLTETQQLTRTAGGLAARKIWLPKLLYSCLPYFYIASGFSAFLATLYISEWFWVLPHYLLFSAVCVHLGILVFRRRQNSSKYDSGS